MFSPTVKISEEFVKKCDYLCKKISKLEWSGVLFYELLNQNSKDLSDLVFEVKDIYLLDIGTAGSTSYEEKNDDAYLDYLMTVPDTWQRGSIHSHNSMNVFFSSIDISDLAIFADGLNMYLSLVVNNKLEFDARITHKCRAKTEIVDSLGNKFTGNENLIYVYDPYIEVDVESNPELDALIDNLYMINAARKPVYTQKSIFEADKKPTNAIQEDSLYDSIIEDFAEEWLELDDDKKSLSNTNILSKQYFQTTIDDIDEGLFNDVYAAISDIGDEKDEKLFYDLIMTVGV